MRIRNSRKKKNFLDFLKMFCAKLMGKKFVIVQATGGLGDYIQVRNFFKMIKEKYGGDKKVCLCVCLLGRYLDFAKAYDSDCVDVFFDLRLIQNPVKKEVAIMRLFKYDSYINFYGGHDYWDEINALIRTKEIHDTKRNQKLYITENNKEFMAPLVDVSNFKLHFDKIIEAKNLKDKDYFLIVPTAYTAGNMSLEQTLELSKYLISKNQKVLIFGIENNEKTIFDKVYEKLNENERKHLINGINQFKTSDIPDVVNRAKLVIAPNTSIFHFSLALDKKVICLTPNFQEYIGHKDDNVKYLIEDNIQNINVKDIIKAIEEFCLEKVK